MSDAITPNWFAYAALLTWPLVAIALYGSLSKVQATLWTIFGAQMLLPVGAVIKFPMIPQIDKFTIPNICVLVGCLLSRGRPLKIFSGLGAATVPLAANLLAPVLSVSGNQDAIFIGGSGLPPADFYNSGSLVISTFLSLVPFLIGRALIRQPSDLSELFRIIVITGLAYTLPTLLELRFSPQLHIWLYGYSPTDYVQVLRGEGYRPMVFMGHGLVLAFFLAVSTMAATARWNLGIGLGRLPPAVVPSYLGLILVLCKSFGATVYALLLTPLIRFTSPRFQISVACLLVSVALSYPLLRSLDVVPTGLIVQAADAISSDRAESLKTRFRNEDALLNRAAERLFFGWGGYGRNRVFNQESGADTSLTDGRWILTMGNYGLLGFIAEFGLLGAGVYRARTVVGYIRSREERILLAALALMVAINIVELLPNSTLTPWTWLLAGTLLGTAQQARPSSRRFANTPLDSIVSPKRSRDRSS
ncbi:hypothetical protein [Bradyrhizobium ganzhouense]|uniref:hypothetical protein n=1 Tax=Bradyrhizobium ganzhouense TaxID=1179767 RepID=UPI003CEAF70B